MTTRLAIIFTGAGAGATVLGVSMFDWRAGLIVAGILAFVAGLTADTT